MNCTFKIFIRLQGISGEIINLFCIGFDSSLLFTGIDSRQHLQSTLAHLLYKDIPSQSVRQANYACIFMHKHMHVLKVDCQIRCV